jgi:hypothetical protein
MALTEGDKAEIKEMAREIVKEVLMEHVQACPHGQAFEIMKAKFLGICAGIGVGSGSLVAAFMKIFGI